jgi:hypothetical protein
MRSTYHSSELVARVRLRLAFVVSHMRRGVATHASSRDRH